MSDSSITAENSTPFRISPRTLLELASMNVAFYFWLKQLRRMNLNKRKTILDDDQAPIILQLDALTQVSLQTKKMIESYADAITRQMKSWNKYSRNVLNHLRSFDIYSRPDLVVFGGNGTVHFENTIDNIFLQDCISYEAKFEIACVFCVEQKVDFFWPLVCDTFCIDDYQFENDFMLYYWICRKKNELNRIPLEEFDSIEHLMINKCCNSGLYFNIKYFLNLLDPHDRRDQVNQLFSALRSSKCLTYLLPHLEAPLQRHILDKKRIDILAEFVQSNDRIEYAVQTWLYIRDFFTAEQFYHDIILRFLHFRKGSEIMMNRFDYKYFEAVLAEIWSETPSHLKEFTLNFHLSDVLDILSKYSASLGNKFVLDIRFLLTILSDADIHSRHNFFTENWSYWIQHVPISQFEELMIVCLVETEAIESFKKTLVESQLFRKCCRLLLYMGHHNDLDRFLYTLYPDPARILNFKKCMLARARRIFVGVFSHDVFFKHAAYIDNIFSGDSVLASDFKDQLIFSDEEVLKGLYNKMKHVDFSHLEFIFSLFVSPNKQSKVKSRFLEYFKSCVTESLISSNFKTGSWRECLLWCLNKDEKKLREFLWSLPIGYIFQNAFSNFLKGEYEDHYQFLPASTYSRYSFGLNKFLRLYFPSKSACKNFKREQIEFYEGMDETDVAVMFDRPKDLVIRVMKELLMLENEN